MSKIEIINYSEKESGYFIPTKVLCSSKSLSLVCEAMMRDQGNYPAILFETKDDGQMNVYSLTWEESMDKATEIAKEFENKFYEVNDFTNFPFHV